MHTSAKKIMFTGVIAVAALTLSLLLLAKTAAGQVAPRPQCYGNFIATCINTNLTTGLCEQWMCDDPDRLARVQGLTRSGVNRVEDVKDVVQDIVGWMQIFFYIVATLTMILAAWNYLNSGGDETKTKAAKNYVIYSLVAIAIAIIAGGIVTLVRNLVG